MMSTPENCYSFGITLHVCHLDAARNDTERVANTVRTSGRHLSTHQTYLITHVLITSSLRVGQNNQLTLN